MPRTVLALILAPLFALAWRTAPAAADRWRLIWSDEFDGSALDPAKWSIVEDCWGGGNNERQCYTADSVSVVDGALRITARSRDVVGPALPEERRGGPGGSTLRLRHYASGKVRTAGKASFRYGRIEARARLPAGQGLWSAIWLLPEHDNYGPFPQSGEIDLAEAVNLGTTDGDAVHGAAHSGPAKGLVQSVTGQARLPDPTGFHVYALEWTPRQMVWLLDGRPYLRAPARPPFDQRFHLILNLAVGGSWPEQNGHGVALSALPATLQVDWVRVYEASAEP